MKNIKKKSLLPIAGMALVLAFVGCRNTQPDNIVSQNLSVEAIADTITVSCVSEDLSFVSGFELGAEVDYPVNGPQPLTDSVKKYVKWELYSIFDWNCVEDDHEEKLHLPFNMVCKWDGDNIVTVFLDNYKPLYESYGIGVGAHYLNLKLVAQTETYVTFFCEYTWCGASCCTSYNYSTFRKKDGQLLNNITNRKKIKSFLKAYPQYKDVFYMANDMDVNLLGLVEEGLKCDYLVLSDWPGYNPDEGWHEIIIPYAEIMPYLNKEVQELMPGD